MSYKTAPFLFSLPAVNLAGRGAQNPASMRLPPALWDADTLSFRDGRAFIGNTPLGDASAQTGPGTQSGDNANSGPVSTKEPGKYGDSVIFAVTFTGAGFSNNTTYSPNGSIVLPRPQNKRASLLIVNFSVVGQIFYNYDVDADNVASVPIAQGGSRNYAGESVPQGNLSLYSLGAGVAIVEYMNVSV